MIQDFDQDQYTKTVDSIEQKEYEVDIPFRVYIPVTVASVPTHTNSKHIYNKVSYMADDLMLEIQSRLNEYELDEATDPINVDWDSDHLREIIDQAREK